jgi:hypothetical protein
MAVSGLNPLNEAYFRFLAQSCRSKSTIQIVMNVGSRPIADPRIRQFSQRQGSKAR